MLSDWNAERRDGKLELDQAKAGDYGGSSQVRSRMLAVTAIDHAVFDNSSGLPVPFLYQRLETTDFGGFLADKDL